MIGLDTTTLIAFDLPDHPLHHQVRNGVRDCIRSGESFAITPGVLDEFIHVVTDSRRFEIPLSMREAVFCARRWCSGKEVSLVMPSEGSSALCLDWLDKFQLERKRILDIALASVFYQEGVTRIATAHPKDFSIFDVFQFEEWALG